MIVHHAPGDAARARCLGCPGDQLEIFAAVFVRKEHRQAAIAALGDVVRYVGKTMRGRRAVARYYGDASEPSIKSTVPGILASR